MTEERVDRRVRRTRQVLRDALIALIQEKGYETISVQDITERANVNRATFYLHYRDKEELLIKSMQDVHDDLVARIGLDSPERVLDAVETMDRMVLEHVQEYADFYRIMLGEKGVAAFTAHLTNYLAKVTVQICELLLPDRNAAPIPLEISAYHFAGATLGVLTWWVTNGMPVPIEEMAEIMKQLDRHDSMWAVGLSVDS